MIKLNDKYVAAEKVEAVTPGLERSQAIVHFTGGTRLVVNLTVEEAVSAIEAARCRAA